MKVGRYVLLVGMFFHGPNALGDIVPGEILYHCSVDEKHGLPDTRAALRKIRKKFRDWLKMLETPEWKGKAWNVSFSYRIVNLTTPGSPSVYRQDGFSKARVESWLADKNYRNNVEPGNDPEVEPL